MGPEVTLLSRYRLHWKVKALIEFHLRFHEPTRPADFRQRPDAYNFVELSRINKEKNEVIILNGYFFSKEISRQF